MKPRVDLLVSHFAKNQKIAAQSVVGEKQSRFTVPSIRVLKPVFATAVVCVGLGAATVEAQQDLPFDDSGPYNSAPQQPYAQQGQYAYGQPQYPQGPAYPSPGYSGPTTIYPQQGYGQQLGRMQPLSPDQLTQLLAPIALYPDGLVAEILAAATYPAQISAADQWLRSMGNAPPDQIVDGADAQSSWDPSVKALTAFPQVLAMLDRNLSWTTSLGNAYYNQPQDVLQTIQVMRERAEAAGNLQSTAQEQVSDNQGYINIAPANQQVVYVPSYNPWDAYGQPVSPYPGFSLLGTIGSFIGSAFVHYGPGIAMSAFMSTPWGWLGWGLDWLAHAILFNHSGWYTHSTSVADWGFPHGGPRSYPGVPMNRGGGWDGHGWPHEGYRAFSRSNEGYDRGRANQAVRPAPGWGDARSAEGFNRGFPQRNEMTARPVPPTQQAYNRSGQIGRPQQFENRPPAFAPRTQPERPGYSSGFYGQQRDNNVGRSGMAYANPAPAYRAPENNYRGSFGGRNYDTFGSANSDRQGSHFFGNHNSDGYGGKAPKAYSFNGGRGAWGGGGSFKAPKAPKESHSFGGGGHFGGGHSGGHGSSGHHH
jgi:Protein of unknown function (DUF3300)